MTPEKISDALDALYKYPREGTLMVMAQNPSDNHYWSKRVFEISNGELINALVLAQNMQATLHIVRDRGNAGGER